MIGSRWRPPLRIAWRTARRHPGRAALVAALVAAPVLGATYLDMAIRTGEMTAQERARREMGTADAVLTVTPYERITPQSGSWRVPDDAEPTRRAASVDVGRLLPVGSRVLAAPARGTVRFDAGDRVTLASAVELDTADPLTAGLYAVRSGRLARAPGEVTLSPRLAERLGTGIGGDVRPAGAPSVRVVGIAVDPGCRSCQLAVGPPGWTGPPPPERLTFARLLVDLPDGAAVDPPMRERLAAAGVLLEPRDAFLHPERWGDPHSGATAALATAVLVGGIGMLEVVLLAGTAFAVAARRRVRDVALVLSNGGRPADVRRMLLAQGLVLGVIGAGAGVAAGIGLLLVSLSGLQRLADMDFAGLVVRPGDLAVVAAVGVLSGVAAAVVPAWSASRVPVVAALTGRYGRPTRAARRVSAVGAAAAAAVGFAVAWLMSARWGAARTAQAAAPEPTPDPSLAYPLTMVAGFGLVMLGLTVLAPGLVGLAGRLAARLPLTGRLALRDAARHRHRTGPAVGAVMVAVAGSVAVAFAVASYDRHDRDRYQPRLPVGWATVWSSGGSEEANLAAGRTAAAELPATRVVPVPLLASRAGLKRADPAHLGKPSTPGCGRRHQGDVSTGPEIADLVAGPNAGQARTALSRSLAVVWQPCVIEDGTIKIVHGDRIDRVPAVAVDGMPGAYDSVPAAVLPASTVRSLHLTPIHSVLVIATSRVPTETEEDRARAAFGQQDADLVVERGYQSEYLPGFLALIGGAGLVTMAGVAISVSLSAAEGQADLATLAAVGAPPRRRRGLAMAQAALVVGLGAGLGVALGAAIGVTIMAGHEGYPLVVPWPTVLVIGVGVPALGVLAVGLATRSRLPLVRRLA